MKLSIITCTYNSEKYLQDCIDSVIAQNLNIDDYEHIFVDAYSTDKTKDIIAQYMKKYSNVKLIERKPKWVYNAMNEGIKEAKWEYILCLNSDDFLEHNILEWYLKFIQETWNKDLYYWKLKFVENWKVKHVFNEKLMPLRKILFRLFWTNALILHPTVLLKREALLNLWLFDENKKIASDYGMRLNILANKKDYIFYPRVISNFRVHESWISSMDSNKKNEYQECKYFKKKYLSRPKYLLSIIIDYLCFLYWWLKKLLQ